MLNNRIAKHIDYSRQKLISTRCLLGRDFLKFRQFYFAHYHKKSDAKFHREIAELLSDISQKRGGKVAIAAPRGSAKSTIVSLEYVIYSICYKLESFIVVISSTADQAIGLLADIKKELQENRRLIQDFPGVCEIGAKPAPPRWTQREIITRNNIKVLALGTGQQIRGRRNKESRPTLIILDDVETDDPSQNPENYSKLSDWLTKSVFKSGTPETNVVCVGTIHHYNSLLAQFVSERSFPGWHKRVYRSVVSWPARSDLWEQWVNIYNNQHEYKGNTGSEAAKEFYKVNEEAMLSGAEVLWPEHLSYYSLMELREQDGYMSFNSEMQNEPINPRDCIFRMEDVHYWEDNYSSEDELLAILGSNKQVYGACDPSLGKQNRRGDYSAIVTAVRDLRSGTLYILDADLERRYPDKTIDDILSYQRRRKYQMFAFEANQFQEFMASELEKRSRQQGCYLSLENIKHTSDKRARIETLQPLIKNGTIQFSKRHHLLLDQMRCFPKGTHDDGLDALEMVVRLAQEQGDGPNIWSLGGSDPTPWRTKYSDE